MDAKLFQQPAQPELSLNGPACHCAIVDVIRATRQIGSFGYCGVCVIMRLKSQPSGSLTKSGCTLPR